MGRWSDMDSDAERLPAGFERIGYDADTQTYTFRDSDGNTYESEPGNRYGELHRVGSAAPSFASSATLTEEYSDDAPSKGTREPARTFDDMLCEQERAMKRGNREAVRMMLPFALLVLVFLILVFKLVNRSDEGATAPKEDSIDCGQDGHPIVIHKGDTCWDIAQTFGITVKELLALHGNDAIDCDRLAIGKGVCVPT